MARSSTRAPTTSGRARTSSSGPAERPNRPEQLPAELVRILRLIPGYDPFDGAEGCWFDIEAADRAVRFFAEMLVHIEGDAAATPFVLSPWEQSLVANLFGWKQLDRRGRVVRRYREVFLYVPRKNGKTPLCAGIALFVFFCDDEAGQQDFLAAKDKDQAGLLFRQMEGMVERNPELAGRCRVYGGNAPAGKTKSFVKDDNSFLKVISADASGKHGGNSHLVIIDELHEQDDRALFDALRTSFTSENRKQPLFVQLTTADYDRPSICNERYENAKKVRDNPARDPRLLPVIYEADPGDPWDAEATWEKCNPNLDVSVSRDELRRMANEAKDNPAFLIEFRRLHTNVRMQQSATKAIDLQLWDACRVAPPPPAWFHRKPCWAGLDLGWRDDLAALVRLWELEYDAGQPTRDKDDNPLPRPLFARFNFWVPAGTKRDLRASPFFEFVAGGFVTVTDGESTDFAAIRSVLEETRRECDLRTVMMDPSYARSEATDLLGDGFPVVEFTQNHRSYSVPWKWFQADGLKGRLLRHDGNPVARWMAGHVAIEVNGTDGVMPKKRKSAEKIDGITAKCMGIAGYLADPNKGGDDGGFEFW